MKRVASNFLYQSLYQLVKILMPIVTIPIISRALGPSGVGLYNFTNSIVQYFILFAGLGIGLYGNREIALVSNDKEKLSRVFWELFKFKAMLSSLLLVTYFIIVSFFSTRLFFYIQSLSLIAVIFDVSWFFMGIQDFKKSSLSSFASQIFIFIMIVLFIRDSNDVGLYIFIQAFGVLLSQLIMVFFLKTRINYVQVPFKSTLRHFRASVSYFIPQVAITLYTNLNKTLLGLFIGKAAVGYYSNSLTLNTVFITLLATLDTVMLPHMSSLFANHKLDQLKKTLGETIHLQLFFSVALFFGILTVYDKFVPWFFSNKFLFINKVIPFVAILVVIVPLGSSLSRQYLLPMGNTRDYNISVMIGAVIGIVTNITLLPTIGFFGVIISNILAEFFVTISRITPLLRQHIFILDLRKVFTYFLSGLIMCIVVRFITENMVATLVTNLVQGIFGFIIYFCLTLLARVNPIFNLIKSKIR